ncbi:ACT domain-domain-containing protein [Syncephalastrum racemosum]|uniref:ACT domain-domain-containing protein n=1 Tax=Syncephalastrum racemosum TaxID=13706 RepID=A0A1X2H918_SYNRA|nr:ACT domain-domain-containing protein [Syncephalastrum racemosum]
MINLKILPDEFLLQQFPRSHTVSAEWLNSVSWYTISKTAHELSVLSPAQDKPLPDCTKAEPGWRCFQVDAQMDFGLVGILASIVDPLRDNKIPVFVVSTFDTDYVFVKQDTLERAIGVLSAEQGITLKPGESVL